MTKVETASLISPQVPPVESPTSSDSALEESDVDWFQQCSDGIVFVQGDMRDLLGATNRADLLHPNLADTTVVFFNSVMFTPAFVTEVALSVRFAAPNLRFFCVSAKMLHRKEEVEKKFVLRQVLVAPMSWIELGTVYIYGIVRGAGREGT